MRRSTLLLLSLMLLHASAPRHVMAGGEPATIIIRPDSTVIHDAFELAPPPAPARERNQVPRPLPPVDVAAYAPHHSQARQVNFQQPPTGDTSTQAPQAATMEDPCRAMPLPPLGQLGINISVPDGRLPSDFAGACWNRINESAGPIADFRAWKLFMYNWDATALCHRPLYFEEVNLERYGYGCGCCLQPLASAAHFFGTVPALPYCMAAQCPHECIYTLGHYRPGSCPPWRHHWPPCEPVAAAAEAGVLTGMIFLIP
jgi:hypothetical protein